MGIKLTNKDVEKFTKQATNQLQELLKILNKNRYPLVVDFISTTHLLIAINDHLNKNNLKTDPRDYENLEKGIEYLTKFAGEIF
jgi:hypothetical protein